MLSKGNIFTDNYYKLLNSENLFDVETHAGREVYKFNPSEAIISLCYEIAKLKLMKTMNANQYGVDREQKDKIESQFSGCIAEFASAKYLVDFCNIPTKEIYVYDALRENFSYASAEEYDIRIVKNGNYDFGIKNSKSYKTTLTNFIERYQLIADYVNLKKYNERIDDFYIRPVIQYMELTDLMPKLVYEPLKKGNASLYLLGGANKKLVSEKGYTKKMGYANTDFYCIDIKDTYTMEEVADYLKHV